MKNDLIKLEEVTKYYTSSGGVGLGLHKVNLSFNLGEFVVITGSSGSGKTTLLNVITGMDTYEEGTIFVEGEDTTYFGAADYEEFRRKYPNLLVFLTGGDDFSFDTNIKNLIFADRFLVLKGLNRILNYNNDKK